MKRYKLFSRLALVMILLITLRGSGYAQHQDQMEHLKVKCQECHNCDKPTTVDPCLNSCPRATVALEQTSHQLIEAPDSILLGSLSELYKPVPFAHKLHAEMAEMGNECGVCHHYSPRGRIPPCRECHDGNSSFTDLPRPGLKVAYHRQCLSCHREWSHETKCSFCHAPKVAGEGSQSKAADSVGIPIVMMPIVKAYLTPEDSLPVVTFQHVEHIELFEFTCKNCHRNEKCVFCHDLERPAELDKSRSEVCDICSNCHEMRDRCPEEGCVKCHDTKEKPPLFHSIVGQKLPAYCQRLGCTGCHPEAHN